MDRRLCAGRRAARRGGRDRRVPARQHRGDRRPRRRAHRRESARGCTQRHDPVTVRFQQHGRTERAHADRATARAPDGDGVRGRGPRDLMADEEDQVYGGRYQLHRRIARGGMADVYLARDALLDRPVALKVLFPEFATDRSFVERFRREAQAAANLSHPNIVSIYDWGEEDGTYFIVMEYVDGKPLSQLIHSKGPLPAAQAADIGA